ncbi:MAG: SpaA isopeptide-forming pilin-related protein [Clostridia bacterium]
MKKIISIILVLLMIIGIISIPSKSNASFKISKADLYSKGFYKDYLRLGNMGIVFNYVVYTKDGQEYPAYCLNKDLDGVTLDSQYTVSTEELLTNVKVWRAIVNGYPYKTPAQLGCNTEEEAYIATKQAVYCMLYDREPSEYNAVNETGTRVWNALNQIVTNAKNSSEVKASADLTIKDVTSNWEQDILNNKYVSKTFTILANASIDTYNVTLEGMNVEGAKIVDEQNSEKNNFKYGENFKIIIPITNMQKEGSFNIKVNGEVATKPVLYGYSADRNKQDYAITGDIYENGSGVKTVYYTENETKIIILKQDENKQPLQGVKFRLLNENKEVLYSELKTNEEGKIIIENLKPGTYYIEETKTANGYAIYEELIEVNLNYNEKFTATITNSKETIEVERPEITEGNKEVVVKLPKTGM